jgi:uncharacterized membrane protein
MTRVRHHSLRRDFRAGIALVIPLAVTYWAVSGLFRFFDGVLQPALAPLLPWRIHGLGVLLLLLGVLAVGAITRSRAGVAAVLWLDRRLSAIPLASWVYGTATQITRSTLDAQRGTFQRCVLVEYPKEQSWVLGFVTADAPRGLRDRLGQPRLMSVFVPTTPNPTSGFLLMVPEERLVDAGIPIETGFRLVISAGHVRVETQDPSDPSASLADFLKRI